MPVFFETIIDENTRLGIWKIEESEDFFKNNVPLHRDVTHPHKRLQHLAGRFLLQYLFPSFPYELIRIADTRKPFLEDEQFHFSISHCGDYAAAIASRDRRVGIDVEIPVSKIGRIAEKFLDNEENKGFAIGKEQDEDSLGLTTILWSAKESVFKWYGEGGVDFRKDIRLRKSREPGKIDCHFNKTGVDLVISYRKFDHLVAAWVLSHPGNSSE